MMTNRSFPLNSAPTPSSTEERLVGTILYLTTGVARGVLASIHWRLSETLNSLLDQDYLMLHEATLEQGNVFSGEAAVTTPDLLVRRDAIVLAFEVRAGVERPGGSQGLLVPKQAIPVLIDVGPFRVRGQVHVAHGASLAHFVHDPHNRFMPVTDATIRLLPGAGKEWAAGGGLYSVALPGGDEDGPSRVGFVMVNRGHINALTRIPGLSEIPSFPAPSPAAAAVAPAASVPAPAVPPRTVSTPAAEIPLPATEEPPAPVMKPPPIDVDLAVAFLVKSAVFHQASAQALSWTVQELHDAWQIDLRRFDAGAVIYEQGEQGNALYLVGTGAVAAERSEPGGGHKVLAQYGPGDLFGEMALFGQRARSETTRAVEATHVVVLHEKGMRRVMAAEASVTRTLMALAQARRDQRPVG